MPQGVSSDSIRKISLPPPEHPKKEGFSLNPFALRLGSGANATVSMVNGLVFTGRFLGFVDDMFLKLKLTKPTDGYTVKETVLLELTKIVSISDIIRGSSIPATRV